MNEEENLHVDGSADAVADTEQFNQDGGNANAAETQEHGGDGNLFQLSQDQISNMIAKAVADELAKGNKTAQPQRGAIRSALPPAKKREDGVIGLSALVAQKAEKEGVKVGKLPNRLQPLSDRYRKANASQLAMEEMTLHNLMQFNQGWDTLAAPCSVVGAVFDLMCAQSYAASIFQFATMERYCEIFEDHVVENDPDFPADVVVTAEAVNIPAAAAWVALAGNPIVTTVVPVHVANPLLVWVLGQDFIAGVGGIYILPNSPKLLANGGVVDLAASPAFTVDYNASLLQNGVCEPAGRKRIVSTSVQVTAKLWQIALRYCDAEMFQIQSRYGAGFARGVLARIVEELRSAMDKDIFTKIWNLVFTTTGTGAGTWSKTTNTIEQLIALISKAAAELIDSECVMPSDLVVIASTVNSDILGWANGCCRIDATNNGDNLGLVGALTQHSYPLYSVKAENLVYANNILIVPRDYLKYFVFQPLSIKESNGVSKDFLAPNGATYNGVANITTWTAFMQTAELILRPSQARYISVTA